MEASRRRPAMTRMRKATRMDTALSGSMTFAIAIEVGFLAVAVPLDAAGMSDARSLGAGAVAGILGWAAGIGVTIARKRAD